MELILPLFISSAIAVLIMFLLMIAALRNRISKVVAVVVCVILTTITYGVGLIRSNQEIGLTICMLGFMVSTITGALAISLRRIQPPTK